MYDVLEEYDERSDGAGLVGHARVRRHREGQGARVSTLRGAGDASIIAEESGKKRG